MKLIAVLVLVPLLLSGSADAPAYQGRSHEEWSADLASGEATVRDATIRSLIAGQGEAAPVLLVIMIKDQKNRNTAYRILSEEMGPAAAPALAARPFLRMRAAPTLEHGRALIGSLGNAGTGWHVGEALLPLGEDALDLLLPVLDREPVEFADRLAVWQALSAIGDLGPVAAPALPRICQFLEEERGDYPGEVFRALSGIGPGAAPAVPLLIRIVRETGSHSTRTMAIRALAAIGPGARAAIPTLILAVEKDGLPGASGDKMFRPSTTRRAAAKALAGFGEHARGAIPALAAALEDGLPATRMRCAVSLVKVGGDPAVAVPVILQEIRRPAPSYGTSGDSPARGYPCRAAELLGELGPAAAPAVPALTRILQSPKPDRMRADPRRDVAWALARMGASARSAAPALEAVLEEEHGLGFNSALALWLVGDASQREKALAAVEGFLERGDYWNPYYAVRALAMAGREARHALPLLVATLDWYKAGEALQVFGVLSIDAAPAVPDLVERLESPWGRKRRNAAKALCAIGPAAAAAVPALTLALADRRPDVRAAAARALGPIGEQAGSAVTSLIPLLVGDDEAVSAAAAAGLVGIGGSAVESLLLLYAEAHPVAVNRAGDVLRRIELLHGTAVPALLARAAGKDEALRGPAMVLLTQMGEAAVSGLGIALENEDSRIRLQAAMELRRIGTAAKPAVPALAKAIQGDDERLAAAARDALCATGMAGIDALLSLLKDQNAVVRRLAAEGLGRWAHLRSVSEGLEKRLDDSDPAVANAVRDAIREGNRKGR